MTGASTPLSPRERSALGCRGIASDFVAERRKRPSNFAIAGSNLAHMTKVARRLGTHRS